MSSLVYARGGWEGGAIASMSTLSCASFRSSPSLFEEEAEVYRAESLQSSAYGKNIILTRYRVMELMDCVGRQEVMKMVERSQIRGFEKIVWEQCELRPYNRLLETIRLPSYGGHGCDFVGQMKICGKSA